jgi:hypothetical protein
MALLSHLTSPEARMVSWNVLKCPEPVTLTLARSQRGTAEFVLRPLA